MSPISASTCVNVTPNVLSAGGNATVVATIVTATASIASPVVRQDRNVTPAAVAASWAAGSAAVSTGETVAASAVTAASSPPSTCW